MLKSGKHRTNNFATKVYGHVQLHSYSWKGNAPFTHSAARMLEPLA